MRIRTTGERNVRNGRGIEWVDGKGGHGERDKEKGKETKIGD